MLKTIDTQTMLQSKVVFFSQLFWHGGMTLEETKNEPLTNDFVCVDIRWALKEKDQALDNLDNP